MVIQHKYIGKTMGFSAGLNLGCQLPPPEHIGAESEGRKPLPPRGSDRDRPRAALPSSRVPADFIWPILPRRPLQLVAYIIIVEIIVGSGKVLNFGLVAHDDRKQAMVDWVLAHGEELSGHGIFATGTTGTRLQAACPQLSITLLKSGPHGGDQQLGAMICERKLDVLIFFVDALSPHPHDVDVKALMRLAILYDLPQGYSESSAGLVMKSLAS